MKNFILTILCAVAIISCTKADVLDENLEGKSYAIDYVDIEQQLNYSDPCNNCGSARFHAIYNWDIKTIHFEKSKRFTLYTTDDKLGGTYEVTNGGKDLVMMIEDTNSFLTFKIKEISKKTLKLDLDWNDTTFKPSSYTLNFYFKAI